MQRTRHNRSSDASSTASKIRIHTPIVISVLVAAFLSVVPLNQSLAAMRPALLFLVTVFWIMHRPNSVGIWFAFSVGLLGDLFLDTSLGQQAFSSVISVLMLQAMLWQRKMIDDTAAWAFASMTLAIYSVLLLVLQSISGQVIFWRDGLPLITGIFTWPLVVQLLKRF